MTHAAEDSALRSKSRKTTLEIRIGNKTIRHRVAAQAFAEALAEMGLPAVAYLDQIVSGLPLISKKGPPSKNGDARGFKSIDGWFIATHSSTKDKKATLEEVADALKIPIKVRILSQSDYVDAVLEDCIKA